ncbi:aconitase family protein [Dickeya oryzae]|uniref:aconitase family protein n=1 Tax=Dickeya oryzae TaxID=1240404 RepID=UPI001FF06425|nr:aconitase family protein [Dickeya oryzae]
MGSGSGCDAVQRLGGQVSRVNPMTPVDLVIDHSVTVDHFGNERALEDNTRLEMARNHERYAFLRYVIRRVFDA